MFTKTRTNRLLALLAIVLIAGAWRSFAAPMTLRTGSKLWFDGTSTVRSWSCQATRMDAAIDAEANAPSSVLDGLKAVRTVTVTFPVAQLDCNGNRTMNGHMWKALNAERHTAITFALVSYDVVKATPTRGTLEGTLTLNGQTRPVTIPVEFTGVEGALKVKGSYPLKMTDWGVEPPKLMMGAMKVGETVTVQFELLLQH